MEERSVEETNSDGPPTKLFIMSSNEYLQAPEFSSTPVSIVSTSEGNNINTINIGLRPPPPLKAAARNRGQSLLKNNLISPNGQSGSTSATPSEDNKRTMWKCKRCNFRHSNRETVSLHVKSHNESEQRHEDEKVDTLLDVLMISYFLLYINPSCFLSVESIRLWRLPIFCVRCCNFVYA